MLVAKGIDDLVASATEVPKQEPFLVSQLMPVFGEMQPAAFPARRERFQGELPVSPALEYDGFFKNFQSLFDNLTRSSEPFFLSWP